jgi:hypothetical protein
MFQRTWHCYMCYNPTNGSVNFEDGWLIKFSFITKNGLEQQPQKLKFSMKMLLIYISYTIYLCKFFYVFCFSLKYALKHCQFKTLNDTVGL